MRSIRLTLMTLAAAVVLTSALPAAAQSTSNIPFRRFETSITNNLNSAVTELTGGANAAPQVQAAVLAALENTTAEYDNIVSGPETSNSAPLEFDIVDAVSGAALTGEGPFTLLVLMEDAADDSLLAVSAFTITATTGSSTAGGDGTLCIYALETNANGEFVGAVNDVAGASGVTVNLTGMIYDPNGWFFSALPVFTSIVFD